MTAPRERFVIVLTPVGSSTVPAIQRLRACLKLMLRGFGLRAIEIRPVGETERPSESEIDAWLTR